MHGYYVLTTQNKKVFDFGKRCKFIEFQGVNADFVVCKTSQFGLALGVFPKEEVLNILHMEE